MNKIRDGRDDHTIVISTTVPFHSIRQNPTMSTVLPPQPTSPGVGIRRKGPKSHPSLPLSAFTPPNSGTSERERRPTDPEDLRETEERLER